jgi:hypothetical protein
LELQPFLLIWGKTNIFDKSIKSQQMPTVEELIEKYQNFTDKELISLNSNISEYTDEAKEALNIVLKKNGGIESIKERIAKQFEISNEISIIKNEIISLILQGIKKDDIKTKIKVDHISQSELEKIIEESIIQFHEEEEDKKIKIRTFFGSVTGGLIGGSIGGVIWGLHMIFTGRMFFILIFLLVIINYGFIKLFTRQSKRNMMVLVTTIIFVLFALLLGQIIFEIFGYMGTK